MRKLTLLLFIFFLTIIYAIDIGEEVLRETGDIIPEQVNNNLIYSSPQIHNPQYSDDIGSWSGSGPWGGNVRSLATSASDPMNVITACGFSMATNVGGVWYSNDGGITWQTSDLYGKPMYTVFASTSSPGEFLAGGRYGLYKSVDSGESWNLLSLQSTFVLKAGEKYNNSDIIIAGYSSNVGVRRSIDGGLNWETVGLNTGFMKGFATTPANPEKMFLCGSSMLSSAFVSSDDGATWQAIGPAGAGEGIYVSPLDEDFILLGHENGLYKTINGGTDWTLVLTSGSGRNVVEKDGVFYAAQYGGGLYESTDNGNTWTLNNNGVVDYYWQATGKSDAGVLFGMWGGIMRSDGFGDTHVMSHEGLDNAFTHALAYFRDTNELWAGTEGSGIYKSTDGGISWESKSNGLSTWWIYDFAPTDDIDYSADRLLVATYNGIFASDDNAENWYQVGLAGTQCSGVEIHPTNTDIFWAGGSMPPIKYTENGGQTWQDCTGFPFALYPKLKIGKNNTGTDRIFITFQQMGSTVYYADDGINFTAGAGLSTTYLPRLSVRHQATTGLPQMIYCATDTGVYQSSDAGENWINAGFYQFCWSVQGSRNEEIYAGTDYGVYFSEDGSTWVAMNENISDQNIWNIVYGQTDDQLFCSTRGTGVYEYSHEAQYFPPPQNLVIEVVNYNDVHMEWESPTNEDIIIQYHTGYDNNGIGNGLEYWICAARFTPDELMDYYDGYQISQVEVHIRSSDFSLAEIIIWEGGSFGDPGMEVYSQDITNSVIIEDWTIHELTTPIPLISNNEYWIGYGIDVTGDHPSSVDAGPAVAGKGDWMYFSWPSGWVEISVAYGLDYNWCITGILSPIDSNDKSGSIEIGQTKKLSNNEITRELIGYKIYRDGVVIAEILDPNQTTYDDLALDSGIYEYGITAVYDEGESMPLYAEVIIILVPPQNFCAVVQEMNNVFCSWDSLDSTGRDFDSYNVYRDNLLVATGITENFYLDVGVPAGTYDYCGTAVYDGGWESEFSNPATVTVDVDDLPVPIVTELIGNYPNPFNPTTTIHFSIEQNQQNEQIELEIYNLKGQKVKTLNCHPERSRRIDNGLYGVTWNGTDENNQSVGSGIYFYKMKAGSYSATKKMILMK